MRRALELAARAVGATGTNPCVGCVIVGADGDLIAEGFHQRFGGPHAEAAALAKVPAGADLSRATLYVTLEPCSHQGKTPPCADAVVAAGVGRVVAAIADPNPQVAGRGLDRLRAAGIDVEIGDGAAEATLLAAPFLKRLATGRPYVIAKYAMTLDGRVASRTGASKWITGPVARAEVHRLRGTCEAIVAGIGTVLADDPLLTARPPGPAACARYVIDPDGRTPADSQLVRTAADDPVTLLVREGTTRLPQPGVQLVPIAPSADGSLPVGAILDQLAARSVSRVFVEGGSRVLGRFFDAGEIDEVHAFIAPKLVGGADAIGPIGGHGRDVMPATGELLGGRVRHWGDDLSVSGVVAKPWLSGTVNSER